MTVCHGAAYVSGINTSRITVIAYTYALDSLAAVIVGGVALSGGKGSALNILLGVLLIGLISNALIIMRVNPYARDVVMGLIIIVTVTLAELGRGKA
jgi:ribose transport system permease protein